MNDNIVDFQSVKKQIDSTAIHAVNDESFSKKKKSISFQSLLFPIKYVLAVSLYLIVVIPLGIIAALRLLFQILGGVAVMGLTIVWFMGANVSGYAVLAAWCALSLCGCADQLFTWWTESRFAFRLFGIGTGSTDRS